MTQRTQGQSPTANQPHLEIGADRFLRNPSAVVLTRPDHLRVLVPPDALLTLEGEEAVRARELLESAAAHPISADADDGHEGRLIQALNDNDVLLPAGLESNASEQREPRSTQLKIVFGITGAVDAVRAPAYLSVLREQRDFEVRIVLTEAATRFVNADGLRWYSGMLVSSDLFGGDVADHVRLGRWADIVTVVPATAEFLCRLAAGGYSDLLSATIAMGSGGAVLAPAMNERMWRRKAVQRAVQMLSEEGFEVVLPGAGYESSDPDGGRGFGGVGVGPKELPPLIRLIARTQPAVQRHRGEEQER